MMSKRFLNAMMVAATALTLLVGFSTVQPSGWLEDYHRLEHIGGVPLEQVWVAPEFDVRDYRTLYIAPIQVDQRALSNRGDSTREMAQRLVEAFRKTLNRTLQDAEIFQIVSTDPYFSTTKQGTLTLQLRVTQFSPGCAPVRALIGFGAGATKVQVEGKLIDNATGEAVAEFADLRMHPGGALVWGVRTAMDSEFLIGVDLKQMIDGIAKLFIYLREEGPTGNRL
jgi:hypothetical protein